MLYQLSEVESAGISNARLDIAKEAKDCLPRHKASLAGELNHEL